MYGLKTANKHAMVYPNAFYNSDFENHTMLFKKKMTKAPLCLFLIVNLHAKALGRAFCDKRQNIEI